MFFKQQNNNNDQAVNFSYWITFSFWTFVLILNSFFEFFLSKKFIESSFVILVMGLTLFYLTQYIYKIVNRYKKMR
jgi:hypothetical protein